MLMRSVLFWALTQRRVVILYRRFGTTYRSHLKGSRSPMKLLRWTSWPLKIGPIRCPEASVKDYHSTLRNTPEERRPQRLYGTYLIHLQGWRRQNFPQACRYPSTRLEGLITQGTTGKLSPNNMRLVRDRRRVRGNAVTTPSSMCLIRDATYRKLVAIFLPVRTACSITPSISLPSHPYLCTCSVQPAALRCRIQSPVPLNCNRTMWFGRTWLNIVTHPLLEGGYNFLSVFVSVLRTALTANRTRRWYHGSGG
jgi:hypothetical protein